MTERANVKKIRFHDLRHTHASILISEGVDLMKVAARLGHANPKITLDVYSHLIPDQENEVAEIFREAIRKFCEQTLFLNLKSSQSQKNEKSLQPLIDKDYRPFTQYDSDWARTSDPHPVKVIY
ncbi:tyrosine-type recombinase/integrase [Heyndrickxia acidicola]|uniref:Tyrosine-type recombinase/integrase n=2 Tax=Heyndrickxia acidicola TaxID=209389 RepID=A0ABU6MM18_9BACI|nr:tyrosine-type recombinase/integrase [Heyndrickxia acidicola]MED1205565.1 tyrosine-type recombinase/integrase [Heyndrickxia acidicola]